MDTRMDGLTCVCVNSCAWVCACMHARKQAGMSLCVLSLLSSVAFVRPLQFRFLQFECAFHV